MWDSTGGDEPDNADSLYLTIDGGEERVWSYGCSTVAGVDQRWWWLPVEAWTMTGCDHEPLALDLPAGEHTIVVRNREEGADIDVAAIAAFVISHDPQVEPSTYLDLGD